MTLQPQRATYATSTDKTSHTISLSSLGLQNGDLLIVAIGFPNSASVTPTATAPGGYTVIRGQSQTSTNAKCGLWVWRYQVGASPPASVQISLSHARRVSGCAYRITGHNSSTPINVSAINSGISGAVTGPSVTTTASNCLLMTFVTRVATDNFDTGDYPSGWSAGHLQITGAAGQTNELISTNAGAYKTQASSGSSGAPAWLCGQRKWIGVTCAVQPGASAPAAPSSLSASVVSSSQINLGWTDNSSDETGFRIERKTGSGGTYSQIATTGANATSYNNTGLAASTTYYYRVRATNANGDSGYSNAASATTQAGSTDDTFAQLQSGATVIPAGNTGTNGYRLTYTQWTTDQQFDARGKVWESWNWNPALNPQTGVNMYPVQMGTDNNLTHNGPRFKWFGGRWNYRNACDAGYSQTKVYADDVIFFNTVGGTQSNPAVILDGMRIYNAHDGFNPRGGNHPWQWQIKNCWLTRVNDDAIENDNQAGGIVEDSLFDGVYSFYSAANTSFNGLNNKVIIRDCLIRLELHPRPYTANDPSIYGHSKFFKHQGDPQVPRLEIHNTIFCADEGIYNNPSIVFGLSGSDGNSVVAASNNKLVWLGTGDFPPDWNNLPAVLRNSLTVTKDINVWLQARASWMNNHGLIDRFSWDPAPGAAVASKNNGAPPCGFIYTRADIP